MQLCQDEKVSLVWSPSSAMLKRTGMGRQQLLPYLLGCVDGDQSQIGILMVFTLEVPNEEILGANHISLL